MRKKRHDIFVMWFLSDIRVKPSGRTDVLSIRLSRALIVVQTNLVCITITLFLTYLLRPLPSDVELFIQAAHIVTFFECRTDLVGQLSRDGQEGMLQIDGSLVENFCLRYYFIRRSWYSILLMTSHRVSFSNEGLWKKSKKSLVLF